MAETGLVTRPSAHSFADTLRRLTDALAAKGISVFATVDHAAGAADVGLALRPTTVVIFGNPRGGTPLMQAAPTIGLDLPLKMLVWQDNAGLVWLTYSDMAWLATRHGLEAELPAVAGLAALLAGLAATAGD